MSSETPDPVKRKRGRPAVPPGLFRANGSRRTQHNRYYYTRAIIALMEEDDPSAFRWLTTNLDEKETSPGTRERRTILAELGRIKKPENLLFAAREICKKKPRTIDAIAWIRAHRRGREKPASEAELALAICRTIENYRATHGELTDEQLLDTLAALHRAVVKELAREH